jgi:hypothetical protein
MKKIVVTVHDDKVQSVFRFLDIIEGVDEYSNPQPLTFRPCGASICVHNTYLECNLAECKFEKSNFSCTQIMQGICEKKNCKMRVTI